MKYKYKVNGLDCANCTQKLEDALNKTLEVWTSGLELALEEFDRLDHLPNRILLCGGGSSLKILTDKLAQTDWYKQLPFTKKPIIQLIKPSQVKGIVDETGKINDHTFITAMGLLRVGMDTVLQYDDETATIKDKINRMLRI